MLNLRVMTVQDATASREQLLLESILYYAGFGGALERNGRPHRLHFPAPDHPHRWN